MRNVIILLKCFMVILVSTTIVWGQEYYPVSVYPDGQRKIILQADIDGDGKKEDLILSQPQIATEKLPTLQIIKNGECLYSYNKFNGLPFLYVVVINIGKIQTGKPRGRDIVLIAVGECIINLYSLSYEEYWDNHKKRNSYRYNVHANIAEEWNCDPETH